MNNPTKEHMETVSRILRYLKMTLGKEIQYKKGSNKELDVFSDVDCIEDI